MGRRLGACWGHLGLSWGHLGAFWGHLGASRGHLGAILGPSWALWGPSWSLLGPSCCFEFEDFSFEFEDWAAGASNSIVLHRTRGFLCPDGLETLMPRNLHPNDQARRNARSDPPPHCGGVLDPPVSSSRSCLIFTSYQKFLFKSRPRSVCIPLLNPPRPPAHSAGPPQNLPRPLSFVARLWRRSKTSKSSSRLDGSSIFRFLGR